MNDENMEPMVEQTAEHEQQHIASEKELITCKEALFKSQEQLRYLQADFENFRRHITRERAQWARMAQTTLLEDCITILDDLERAVAQMQKNGETQETEGVELVYKNFVRMLAKHGVTEIATQGMFNPQLHEALMQVETVDQPSGTILQTLQKGYMYKDVVLRPAKVSVAQ